MSGNLSPFDKALSLPQALKSSPLGGWDLVSFPLALNPRGSKGSKPQIKGSSMCPHVPKSCSHLTPAFAATSDTFHTHSAVQTLGRGPCSAFSPWRVSLYRLSSSVHVIRAFSKKDNFKRPEWIYSLFIVLYNCYKSTVSLPTPFLKYRTVNLGASKGREQNLWIDTLNKVK